MKEVKSGTKNKIKKIKSGTESKTKDTALMAMEDF